MANSEVPYLQGIDTVAYVRLLENQNKERGQLIPFQTSLKFDPSVDSDSNPTKSGNVTTSSSLTTDLEVEFVNNISKVSDYIYDSLLLGKKIEVWIIYYKRVKDGKYFSFYMRGNVTEDSNENDPDDNSNRDATFSIDGKPKRGWTTIPDDAKEEIDYVYRGIGQITEDDTTGGGIEWTSGDIGLGSESGISEDNSNKNSSNNPAPKSNTPSQSSGTSGTTGDGK